LIHKILMLKINTLCVVWWGVGGGGGRVLFKKVR